MNEFAKNGLSSSSLSTLILLYTKKRYQGKSLIPFLARKERLDRASPVLLASQALPFFVPFASQKNGLLSSSLSYSISHSPKRKSTKIIPCAFSGAEGETRQGKPCLACFASSPIFCPFCFAKDGLLSSSLSHLFAIHKEKVSRKNP